MIALYTDIGRWRHDVGLVTWMQIFCHIKINSEYLVVTTLNSTRTNSRNSADVPLSNKQTNKQTKPSAYVYQRCGTVYRPLHLCDILKSRLKTFLFNSAFKRSHSLYRWQSTSEYSDFTTLCKFILLTYLLIYLLRASLSYAEVTTTSCR